MRKRLISNDWYFSESGQNFTRIDLPHDYAITKPRAAEEPTGPSNGYYPDHNAFYVKHLTFENKAHYILDLDGSYMNTQIYLNENYVDFHPYGYTPFLADLTPYVLENRTNKLKITLNPFHSSCRWYTGNGIYRDVFLWEGGSVRIEPWDLFVSTVSADEDAAALRLRYTVTADEAKKVTIRFSVLGADEVCVRTEEIALDIPAGKTDCEHLLKLRAPLLWNIDTPNLYTLKTEIFDGETVLDTSLNPFGIRTVTADAENGLRINGKSVKLRGGCIHHDHGVLGAASFPAAEERKVRLLKEAGFNAIRTAHNPPSLAFLEACDKLGIVVMDEAFDCWNKPKKQFDYHLFFEEWCMRDLSYMVKRDRSHPCVFSYSIGNEILEIDGSSDAAGWSRRLSDEIRKYDDTKFVTSGIQKSFVRSHRADEMDPDDYRDYLNERFIDVDAEGINAITKGYEDPLDIVGVNYYFQKYELDHEMYPDRVLWGSETQVLNFYESWQQVKEHPYVLGDFTWTSFDNMGEAAAGQGIWARNGVIRRIILGDYPWRACYQGDFDLCGYRRPQSYFREAVWLGNADLRIFVTHPEHFGEGYSGTYWHWYDVNETWTFEDKYIGRPITVETYTDADEILWLVNEEEIARIKPERCIARLNTVYRKGSITAIAYKNGEECARTTLHTIGAPAAVNVLPEKTELLADHRDLCYFRVSVVDKDGNLCAETQEKLRCIVSGGELLGFASGNPCCDDQYGSDTCHTFKGRAIAVIRAKDPGKVSVFVCSDTLAPGSAEVTAK